MIRKVYDKIRSCWKRNADTALFHWTPFGETPLVSLFYLSAERHTVRQQDANRNVDWDIFNQYPDHAQYLIDDVYSLEIDIDAPVWDTPLRKDIPRQLIVYHWYFEMNFLSIGRGGILDIFSLSTARVIARSGSLFASRTSTLIAAVHIASQP